MEDLKWACDYDIPQMFKKHRDDAGYDICCIGDVTIPPHPAQVEVKTGLHLSIPRGNVGIIKPRSGLSLKFGTQIGAGVIDPGYTGEVIVLLSTLSKEPVSFEAGSRIAQLLVIPLSDFPATRVTKEQLGITDRGANGFGSTGGF